MFISLLIKLLFLHPHEQVIRWVHLSFYSFVVQIRAPTRRLSRAFTSYVLVVVLNAKVNNLVQYNCRQKAERNSFISWNKRTCSIIIHLFFFFFRKGVEFNSQCNDYHSPFINRIMVEKREREWSTDKWCPESKRIERRRTLITSNIRERERKKKSRE
jgi:hypothetical protein